MRLRVDYGGFTTINPQRFGQEYVGKVANPHDMLAWAKTKRAGPKKVRATKIHIGGGAGHKWQTSCMSARVVVWKDCVNM